jgi:hypothetical protein
MLKHLLLYSIITDFIGALGVLNSLKDTLWVQMIAVALGRLDLVHLQSLTDCRVGPPPPPHIRKKSLKLSISHLLGKTPFSTIGNGFFYKKWCQIRINKRYPKEFL